MVAQYRVIWNVPGGGVGYSVMHGVGVSGTGEAALWAAAIRTLFNLGSILPNEVTLSFDSEVLELDEVTGALTAVYPITPPAAIVGTGTGGWAGGVGARWTWGTGEIIAGRRLTGKTYVVPLVSTVYDTDGTLIPGTLANLVTQAQTYLASFGTTGVAPVVWSRTHGVVHAINSVSVRDKSAILRSRRDG